MKTTSCLEALKARPADPAAARPASRFTRRVLLGAVTAVSAVAALPRASFATNQRSCADLARVQLPETTITGATAVTGGTFAPPGPGGAAGTVGPTTPPLEELPPFCRVVGVVAPEINFEVWMPLHGWNGKLYGVGVGGWIGSIQYQGVDLEGAPYGLADVLKRGYAAVASDGGHVANPDNPVDASWAAGHPERITSYAFRAIKETTANARRLIAAFYRARPRHSYIAGCSGGGRAGLVMASRYPEAGYDGVIAGAPANPSTQHLTRIMMVSAFAHTRAGAGVPVAKMSLLRQAVLAACDANDGLVDGLVQDPTRCRFDPTKLRCQGADGPACLTPPQVATVERLYQPLKDEAGRVLIPGLPRGQDFSAYMMPLIIGDDPQPDPFSEGFFKHWVYEDPNWDFRTFDPIAARKLADERYAAELDATDDLRTFAAAGGKLILFQGWSDEAISPEHTIAYYEKVVAKARHADFARLFLAPGMGHCGSGASAVPLPKSCCLQGLGQHRRSQELPMSTAPARDAAIAAPDGLM